MDVVEQRNGVEGLLQVYLRYNQVSDTILVIGCLGKMHDVGVLVQHEIY